MGISKCRTIEFPQLIDTKGNLVFIEGNCLPFEIKRAHGTKRGGHVHKIGDEVIIALRGSLEVKVDDGNNRKSFFLNKPHYGLYIPSGIWIDLANFSPNSVALVLSSTLYKEEDYIKNYAVFKRIARKVALR